VSVDQIDIAKLSVGMPVEIALDALPDSAYTGTLLEIDTTVQDGGDYYGGGGSTNYKAKVVFTKKPEDTILGAMTARLTIVLDEVHNVLVVPNMAISNGFEGTTVMKVENGKYKKVTIET
jgi:multidrug efflux pump subunit AcrA (membrane-fusion protein)